MVGKCGSPVAWMAGSQSRWDPSGSLGPPDGLAPLCPEFKVSPPL